MSRMFWIKKEEGQSMVEMALVIPLFLSLVFMAIETGWQTYQRMVFDQGYMFSSWTISAGDLGDDDPLEETGDASRKVYTGSEVTEPLMKYLEESSLWGLIPANLNITNAKIELYNTKKTYKVPSRTPSQAIDAEARTRYMDLTADLEYNIYPLTYIGEMIFGPVRTIEKTMTYTRVVKSANRAE